MGCAEIVWRARAMVVQGIRICLITKSRQARCNQTFSFITSVRCKGREVFGVVECAPQRVGCGNGERSGSAGVAGVIRMQ